MTVPTRAALTAAAGTVGCLLLVYIATGAPSLTFWDASEFATAIGTFGIPHPPGTPLYVAMGRALSLLLPGVSPVFAGTLLSAIATASACGIAAWLSARITGRVTTGLAAGICAGAMGSVWTNATETEVYAVVLLCSALQLLIAWHAHASDDDRARVLLFFVVGLAVPVHLSLLVATPAALLLAFTATDGQVRWREMVLGVALCIATFCLSQGRAGLAVAVLLIVVATGTYLSPLNAILSSGDRARRARWLRPAAAVTLVAWSATFILLVRARQTPFLNQGDPDTWRKLLDVVSRAQYNVAGLWPRRAPFWLQLGNIAQYADWQVALGLWNDVTPSFARTPFTLGAVVLGAIGAVAHWRTHRITGRVAVVLLVCATVGVCVQLNLHAGPSFGVGVLPEAAPREARERDYFYALAFWMWGLWIGAGVLALAARRSRAVTGAALLVPALMLLGNWSAMNRRSAPERALAHTIAAELLHDVPRGGMLLTGADNDSYPLWYLQAVESVRPDVHVVVTSLLPADWYLAETNWRSRGLTLGVEKSHALLGRAGLLARLQLDRRGTLSVTAAMDSDLRIAIGELAGITCWRRVGLIDIGTRSGFCPPRVDLQRAVESASRLASVTRRPARQSPDGMEAVFQALAQCPARLAELGLMGAARPARDQRQLLDITCNLR